jgi:hypothetical protein
MSISSAAIAESADGQSVRGRSESQVAFRTATELSRDSLIEQSDRENESESPQALCRQSPPRG